MNELDRYAVSLENMEVLRAQVEALEAWKAEELALMNPLMDYARSVCTGQLGCSLTEWLVEDHKAQAREIERLNGTLTLVREQRDAELIANDILERELAALKAQPSGVVQWPDADEIMQMAFEEGQPGDDASGYYFELEEFDLFLQRLMEEVARLNSSPVSAGDDRETIRAVFLRNGFTIKEGQADLKPYVYAAADELMSIARAALSAPSHGGGVAHTDCRSEDGITVGLIDSIITSCRVLSSRDLTCEAAVEALRDLRSDSDVSLIKPNHGEQVREGWRLVPIEPTDAMLAAGDKYIGTPATYKSMLSACPSPAITKDFSQFLSAVMDAAGLIRHGRQSKELSEYLGMKCMEYRGAALSAPSHSEQVRDNRAEFKREERYMVVKLSKLADDLGGDELSREEQIYRLAHFGKALVECVVVESDWPEYEPTWAAIKARVTGSIASNQLPGGWAAKPTDDGEGFIISSPRVNGVASHFSVFPDSKDYASRALWKMLAAAPSAGSHQGGDV